MKSEREIKQMRMKSWGEKQQVSKEVNLPGTRKELDNEKGMQDSHWTSDKRKKNPGFVG